MFQVFAIRNEIRKIEFSNGWTAFKTIVDETRKKKRRVPVHPYKPHSMFEGARKYAEKKAHSIVRVQFHSSLFISMVCCFQCAWTLKTNFLPFSLPCHTIALICPSSDWSRNSNHDSRQLPGRRERHRDRVFRSKQRRPENRFSLKGQPRLRGALAGKEGLVLRRQHCHVGPSIQNLEANLWRSSERELHQQRWH